MRPILVKFHMLPPSRGGGGGVYIHVFGLGHMIKMASGSIYDKNLKNLLLQNHRADCLEAWYVSIFRVSPLKIM